MAPASRTSLAAGGGGGRRPLRWRHRVREARRRAAGRVPGAAGDDRRHLEARPHLRHQPPRRDRGPRRRRRGPRQGRQRPDLRGAGHRLRLRRDREATGSTAATTATPLYGEAGRDRLRGQRGIDYLAGAEDGDLIAGGPDAGTPAGADVASYAGKGPAVSVDLEAGEATGQGLDRLVGIEGVMGSPGPGHDRGRRGPELAGRLGERRHDQRARGRRPDRGGAGQRHRPWRRGRRPDHRLQRRRHAPR